MAAPLLLLVALVFAGASPAGLTSRCAKSIIRTPANVGQRLRRRGFREIDTPQLSPMRRRVDLSLQDSRLDSSRVAPLRSMWGDDELLPMGDFSDLDAESLREFKKKMQISDKEWAEMGLPKLEEERQEVKVERTDSDEKLDQQAFQYVISKLKEFREDRDMGPIELKLVLMAGLDARNAAQMTYEDEETDSDEYNDMIAALEEIINTGKIPSKRDALRQLATELAQMPVVDPENKTRRMKKISAMEQGKEYVEEQKPLTPKDVGGLAAVWGVTAVPVLIGLAALYILYSSSGTVQ